MVLHQFLEYFAREHPQQPCMEYGDAHFTYHQVNAHCNQMAHAFLDSNLTKGDRVAWLSKNCIEQMQCFYAGSKVGVVTTPLNYRLAPPEWAYIINDCQAKVLVCEQELAAGIDKIREQLEYVEHFICLDGPRENWQEFALWIEGHPAENPAVNIDASDVLYQMYTSGTTGLPKGAILSQRAIEQNVRMISCQIAMTVLEARFLLVMPLYHAGAGIALKSTISHGGCIVLHREFDPAAVVNDFETKAITNCTLVPAMIQACLVAVPDIAERKFPQLKVIGYGASPIAEETLRTALNVFGCDFAQAFGMTETTAIATLLSPDAHRRALAGEPHLLLSCGRAALGTEVRIVDKDDNELPRGEIGEVAIKGPQLMDGYWNLPEATASSLRGGWMYTGDAGRMDDEGFLYIEDRIKDMIVSGGENIYPKEVENALFNHPNVADAAVIGIPSDQWGETVMAFIATKDGQDIPADEIISFCREQLAGYKVPRTVECIAQIPRNASGKILKKDLREPFWQGVERRVG